LNWSLTTFVQPSAARSRVEPRPLVVGMVARARVVELVVVRGRVVEFGTIAMARRRVVGADEVSTAACVAGPPAPMAFGRVRSSATRPAAQVTMRIVRLDGER
jgi:hypothetical protein